MTASRNLNTEAYEFWRLAQISRGRRKASSEDFTKEDAICSCELYMERQPRAPIGNRFFNLKQELEKSRENRN